VRLLAGILAMAGASAAITGAIAGEDAGSRAFAPCRACHSLEKDAGMMAGPTLSGLIGRAVGGDPGFEYSPVLRAANASGLVWTGRRLDAFLADPEAMFPGMWMSYPGIRDEAERAELARFIATATTKGGCADAEAR